MSSSVAELQRSVLDDLVRAYLTPVNSGEHEAIEAAQAVSGMRGGISALGPDTSTTTLTVWMRGSDLGPREAGLARFFSLLEIAARLSVVPAPLPRSLRSLIATECSRLVEVGIGGLPNALLNRVRSLPDFVLVAPDDTGDTLNQQSESQYPLDLALHRSISSIDDNVLSFWSFLDQCDGLELDPSYQRSLAFVHSGSSGGLTFEQFDRLLSLHQFDADSLRMEAFLVLDLLQGFQSIFELITSIPRFDITWRNSDSTGARGAAEYIAPLTRDASIRSRLRRIAERLIASSRAGHFGAGWARQAARVLKSFESEDQASISPAVRETSPTSIIPTATDEMRSVAVVGFDEEYRASIIDALRASVRIRFLAAVQPLLYMLLASDDVDYFLLEERFVDATTIKQLREQRPTAAIVVVLSGDPESTASLRGLTAAGVHAFVVRGVNDSGKLLRKAFDVAKAEASAEQVLARIRSVLPQRLMLIAETVIRSPDQIVSVPKLAAALGVHRKTVFNWCEREHFISPNELIAWLRLLLVSHYLQTTRATIETIALELGYPSDTSLRNMIKRYTGVRATDVRSASRDLVLEAFKRRLGDHASVPGSARV